MSARRLTAWSGVRKVAVPAYMNIFPETLGFVVVDELLGHVVPVWVDEIAHLIRDLVRRLWLSRATAETLMPGEADREFVCLAVLVFRACARVEDLAEREELAMAIAAAYQLGETMQLDGMDGLDAVIEIVSRLAAETPQTAAQEQAP